MRIRIQKIKISSVINTLKKLRLILIPLAILFICYLAFFNWVEPHYVGLARNHLSGKTWVQEAGIHFSAPWSWVSTIPTRPIRVEVPTAGRGYTAKLVRFVPEYADDFMEREGWRYYWWYNRISFNFGHEDEYRGFKNIMLGYAYTKKGYPFIEVIEEYEDP